MAYAPDGRRGTLAGGLPERRDRALPNFRRRTGDGRSNPSQELVAIRPDGHGDVTKSSVVWKEAVENIPDITSPVSNGELVFTVTSTGRLTRFDAKDGREAMGARFRHGLPGVARHRGQPPLPV